MREIDEEVVFQKWMDVTETAVVEKIATIYRNDNTKEIVVSTESFNANDEVIKRKEQTISGSYYELLMSESPDFAPGKPANDYRENDLWFIIDLIRTEEIQTELIIE